jgi:hypothetical protein
VHHTQALHRVEGAVIDETVLTGPHCQLGHVSAPNRLIHPTQHRQQLLSNFLLARDYSGHRRRLFPQGEHPRSELGYCARSRGGFAGRETFAEVLTAHGSSGIDDCEVLRAGATSTVLGHAVAAPSTIGTFLRAFSWAHTRQLDSVSKVMLARAWAAGAGPLDRDAPFTIDLDSSVHETYGLKKEGGTRFSYDHVRGYHPLYATAADTGEVLHARLRGGNSHTARGAVSFLAETFSRVRSAGVSGPLRLRADSGFYSKKVVDACQAAAVGFSITVKLYKSLLGAISQIPEEAWQPIPYWLEDGADVAVIAWQAFASKGKGGVACRLVVRRVKPTPGSQLALIATYSYHAFITDLPGDAVALDEWHRAHAVVENAIRDLKYGAGLNHLPSGRFGANAAWLAVNVMAHNMSRWVVHIGRLDIVPAAAAAADTATADTATADTATSDSPAPTAANPPLRRRRTRRPPGEMNAKPSSPPTPSAAANSPSPAASPAPPASSPRTSPPAGPGPRASTPCSPPSAPSNWSPEAHRQQAPPPHGVAALSTSEYAFPLYLRRVPRSTAPSAPPPFPASHPTPSPFRARSIGGFGLS